MIRTLISSAALVLALSMSSAVLAQEASGIEVARALVEAERKLIVATNVGLTDAEADAFWPVYNDYRESIRKVEDKRVNLLRDLAAEFDTLSGERAQEMLKMAMSINEERIKMKRKHLKSFNKVLPLKKVVRYYQIESKLDTLIEADIAKAVPLVN